MPDKNIPTLTAYLWDLRAQCEAQLRALTLAQRILDEYRDADTPPARRQAKDRLLLDLKGIIEANAAIRESAHEAVRHAADLVAVP